MFIWLSERRLRYKRRQKELQAAFEKDLKADLPITGRGSKIFKISLVYWILFLPVILYRNGNEQSFDHHELLHKIYVVFGPIWGLCMLYNMNYLVIRTAKNRFIICAWWGLMGLGIAMFFGWA
jgi:hypothetical protein